MMVSGAKKTKRTRFNIYCVSPIKTNDLLLVFLVCLLAVVLVAILLDYWTR